MATTTLALPRTLSVPKVVHPVGGEIARLWRSLLRDLFDPYRPERHYMRGPGPKWHAKHRRVARA